MNLKQQILNAPDREMVPVDVAEWGTRVYVRTLSGTERERFEEIGLPDGKAGKHFYACLLAIALYDEAGKRIFEESDIPSLSEKSNAVLKRLYRIASKQNRMNKEDEDAAAKNS